MTEAAVTGSAYEEIAAYAAEQAAPAAAEATPAGKPETKGFVDPLDESLFSDEALKDPKVVQERAKLLQAEIKNAIKIRQAAHNARAEAERKEARFKGTKNEVLGTKAALQNQHNLIAANLKDLQSGDPARFTAAIERLANVKDGGEYWRSIATHLATGKPITRETDPEVLALKQEVEALKAAKLAEIEQQSEAQIDHQLRQIRIHNVEQARTFTDLPYVSNVAQENPDLVDARLCDIMQQHHQRTGQPLDLRAACDIVESEIRSHFELLQRAGGASGVTNGARGAAAPVAGQAGNPVKPEQARSSPRQTAPSTLPSSLSTEPAAANRRLTPGEERDALIERLDSYGFFGGLGM